MVGLLLLLLVVVAVQVRRVDGVGGVHRGRQEDGAEAVEEVVAARVDLGKK